MDGLVDKNTSKGLIKVRDGFAIIPGSDVVSDGYVRCVCLPALLF